MTKYSSAFKIQACQRYFNEPISKKELAKELNIGLSILIKWIDLAEVQGLSALSVKKDHRSYSLEFKLGVVRYYKTHEMGMTKVAAKFNINASQVYSWNKAFNEMGSAGLVSRDKGRPPMKNKTKKKLKKSISADERQNYKDRIIQLEAQLHQAELERDILKNLPPRSKMFQTGKRQKP